MGFELNILDWFQTLHTPVMDKLMTSVTKLGDAGIFWIILTLIFLIIPKMRKTGVTMAAALIVDLLLCNVLLKNLVARTRPYDVNTTVELLVAKLRDYSFPSGHTAASFASVTALPVRRKKDWAYSSCDFMPDSCIQIIFVCALSNRCSRWNHFWMSFRMAWISHCEICRREKDSKIIMHKIRVSICFYGRVQGVGFRYKLRYLAEKYSVTGWARNEYDGSVSTELQGLEEDIDKILQALYNDRYIEIDDIRKRSLPVDEEERGFGVRY